MLGKIVQLLNVPLKDEFSIVEGIEFCKAGKANLKFASLTLMCNPFKDDYNVTYCWEFLPRKQNDGFKDIWVNNSCLVDSKPEKEIIEERLWLIIPWASKIETTAKKIAGRYPDEAILEMKAGDTVTVNTVCAKEETYMAVQAGNELFLLKKTR